VLFDIESIEAQQHRRNPLQHRIEARRLVEQPGQTYSRFPQFSRRPIGTQTPDGLGRAPCGTNDGKAWSSSHTSARFTPADFCPCRVEM